MRITPRCFFINLPALLALVSPACAVTNVFFHGGQTATILATNMTSTTIQSGAYEFTYSVDGWWSATPGGPPTGRFFSVLWPDGVQAQAITAGPTVGSGANITLKRTDNQPFELRSFTAKLLANTGGAGGAFELMPQVNGEDALPDPLMFNATGSAGQSFGYSPMLAGYNAYVIHLYVDYALMQLTVADDSLPPVLDISTPSPNQVRLSWPTNTTGYSLEQNSDFNPANWTTVTNPLSVAGTNSQITLPRQGATAFFRLVMP